MFFSFSIASWSSGPTLGLWVKVLHNSLWSILNWLVQVWRGASPSFCTYASQCGGSLCWLWEFQSMFTWSCCLWSCGEAAHAVGSMWQGKLITSGHWKPNQKEERAMSQYPQAHSLVTKHPPTRLYLLKVPYPPNCQRLRNKPSAHGFGEHSRSKLANPRMFSVLWFLGS